MFVYIVRRFVGMLLSLWVAITLTFFVIHIVPGDPAEAALSQSTASEDVLERRRAALGLDQPLSAQYRDYLNRLLHGDLGLSWSAGQPVLILIGSQINATIRLAVAGMAVAVAIGGLLGVGAALGHTGLSGEIYRSAAGVLLALPVMFTGTLVVWVFAVLLGWFPAVGQGRLHHIILPALVVGASVAGGIARTVESGVVSILNQPFVQTARAKGMSRINVIVKHALRVGLLPTLDIVALQFGFLLGGTVVTEAVFARQGIGRVLLTAVLDKDLPTVQGIVILSACVYGVLNLLADLAHVVLDPRLRVNQL